MFLAGLTCMHANIDKARSKACTQAIDIPNILRHAVLEQARLGLDDRLALCQDGTWGIQAACRVKKPCIGVSDHTRCIVASGHLQVPRIGTVEVLG